MWTSNDNVFVSNQTLCYSIMLIAMNNKRNTVKKFKTVYIGSIQKKISQIIFGLLIMSISC